MLFNIIVYTNRNLIWLSFAHSFIECITLPFSLSRFYSYAPFFIVKLYRGNGSEYEFSYALVLLCEMQPTKVVAMMRTKCICCRKKQHKFVDLDVDGNNFPKLNCFLLLLTYNVITNRVITTLCFLSKRKKNEKTNNTK